MNGEEVRARKKRVVMCIVLVAKMSPSLRGGN